MEDKIITDYIILQRKQEFAYTNEINTLTGEVNTYIKKGWQPFGDPFGWNDKICQAMVKEKTDADNT